MILGFDPSLTSSGFCYDNAGEIITGRILTKDLRGVERLAYIRDQCSLLMNKAEAILIAYEGYAMGANVGRAFDIGELGGVLKLLAFELDVDILVVPPRNLKLFATGSGNAKKPEVIKAVADVWGYNIPRDDEADAFVLYKMGEAYRSKRVSRGYEEHARKALEGCQYIRAKNLSLTR